MTYGEQTGRSRGPARAIPLILAIVVGLVLVLVVRALVTGGGDDGAPSSGPTARGQRTGCTALHVTASSEKAALLSRIAADYNRSGRTVDGTCVDVQVTSKASGGAAEALARGWNEQVDGPRPDVWTPGVVVLVGAAAAAHRRPGQGRPGPGRDARRSRRRRWSSRCRSRWPRRSAGRTSRSAGRDVLSLARDPKGWGGKGHAEWGAFKLGKTNPQLLHLGPQRDDRRPTSPPPAGPAT